MITVSNIHKSYGTVEVLKGIDVSVQSAEVVGLLGPNGAGKTTMFYVVCGLVGADDGVVKLDDEDISHLALNARARKGIGYLPQESSIFKDLSVEDNLYLAAEIVYKKDKKQINKIVEELLEKLSIAQIRSRRGINLSGGERRRVEIARALVMKPKFILLDEPFAGVDPIAVIEIQNIIRFLKSQGLGVLITDHSVRETLSICDKAYVLNNGRIIASGSPSEVAQNEEVIANYLGENFSL